MMVRASRRCLLVALAVGVGCLVPPCARARADDVRREVLAFYYGWYGNPVTSGHWVHWKDVDAANEHIGNATHFPTLGAYDSHDPTILERQAEAAHAAGITGFIASWWGQGDFTDQGIPLLLAAAGRHELTVTAYYEMIRGPDEPTRMRAAVADLDYLFAIYGTDKAWLRAGGKPAVFIYKHALQQLPPAVWRQVVEQVRRDNPGGVRLIADSLDPAVVALFDGASTYNVTGQTQHKTPAQVRAWAHEAYPHMVAAAAPGKISSVTVMPGCDDRELGHPGPRPVTERWGGEVYEALWREAIAARPDYVLITTWNEWHEGTELEASVEYGNRMLDDTAAFAREFLAGK
jgi:glycoprotein endo-alpha-1,2-mannosidase